MRIHHISTEIVEVEPQYILNNKGVSKAVADSVMRSSNVSSVKVIKGIETGGWIVIKTKDQVEKEEELRRSTQTKIKEYIEKLKREGLLN